MGYLISLIIVGAIAYFAYSKNQKNLLEKSGIKKTTARESNKDQSQYRCVAIKPGKVACRSAQILKGKPILMSEAISLPLQGCNLTQCDCQFERRNDRRVGDRREGVYVASQIMVDEHNQRNTKDRRR